MRRCLAALLLTCGLCMLLISSTLAEGTPTPTPAPSPSPTPKSWNFSGGLGCTMTSGNKDTLMGNASMAADATCEMWKIILGADGEYGETEEEKSAERAKGSSQINYKMVDKFYWMLLTDLEHDAVADVEYRLKAVVGAGVNPVKTDHALLSFELGPGYMREKLGDGTEADILTFRASERFQVDIQPGARFWQSVEYLPDVEDFSAYLLNAEMGVEASVSKKVALRFVMKETYDSEPAMDKESTDLSLITSLLWKL